MLGRLSLLEGNFSEATRRLDEASRKVPRSAGVYLSLARAYFKAGELQRAKEQVQKALELKPGLCEALVFLARVQLRKQDYSAALATCHEVLERFPGDTEALMLGGVAHMERGETDEIWLFIQEGEEIK